MNRKNRKVNKVDRESRNGKINPIEVVGSGRCVLEADFIT